MHEATDTLYLVALWYGIPGLIFFFMHNKDLGLGGLNLLIGIAFAGLAHWSRQSSKAFGVAILAMLIHFFASFGVFKAAQAREVAESITYGSDTFPVMLAEGAAMGSFIVLWGAGAYVLRGLFASGHIATPAAPAVELPASHS